MARGYAACLGAIALLISSLRAILDAQPSYETLSSALTLTFAFTVFGYVVGTITDSLIRQSVEANFRQTVQRFQDQRNSTTNTSSS